MPVTRRSARLRGETPVLESLHSEQRPSRSAYTLPSVVEQNDEPTTPKHTQSTPLQHLSSSRRSFKTPSTVGNMRPSLEEMHPSKVHQSTSKQVDSGLVLGFRPIHTESNAPGNTAYTLSTTPSKGGIPHPDQLEALSNDFKLCGNFELSTEAQEIMKSVRKDVVEIKAGLKAKQTEENLQKKTNERKIAAPKGKMGRFSEVHMAQFKKMDSIINHPSSFRACPERVQSASKGLKRTVSKARLDEHDKSSPSKSKVKAPTATEPILSSKRPKNTENEDISTRRPLLKNEQALNKASSKPDPTITKNPSTPHKPTVARSVSVKHPQTTRIPSTIYSPSKSNAALVTPRTDLRPKTKMAAPAFGTALKSILRRRQPLYSSDPFKIAAGTHQPLPSTASGSKLLFTIDTDNQDSTEPSAKKRVEFSDSTKLRDTSDEFLRQPQATTFDFEPEDATNGQIVYPALPPLSPSQVDGKASFFFEPSPSSNRKISTDISPRRRLIFSTPSAIPHGIKNKKRSREDDGTEDESNNVPTGGEDTQRSAKRLKALSTPKPQTPRPAKHHPMPNKTPRSAVRATASSARKSGLSLSRLSFLARPKQRG